MILQYVLVFRNRRACNVFVVFGALKNINTFETVIV